MSKRRWLKSTPWRRGLRYIEREKYWRLSRDEMLFALLCWVDVPRNLAYSLVFPQTQASDNSLFVMSSRLFCSVRVQRFLDELAQRENNISFRYAPETEQTKHPY